MLTCFPDVALKTAASVRPTNGARIAVPHPALANQAPTHPSQIPGTAAHATSTGGAGPAAPTAGLGAARAPGQTFGGRMGAWGNRLGSIRGMAGLGAAVGAAKGLIAPGVEYDEQGRPHRKSRIGAALSGAGTGALVGGGVGVLGKATGAGKALGNWGAKVDAGTANAPDWMHSVHEGAGGGQSQFRADDLATRPAKAAMAPNQVNIPASTQNVYHVTQKNGVGFKFTVHGHDPRTGDIHGLYHAPDGSKQQTSFNAAHVASMKPLNISMPQDTSPMQTATISRPQPKAAALRLVRDDIYLVAATNGEGFIGTYKGASADDRAVFLLHAPGVQSVEAAFDMRKLAHISPVINTKTGSVARSRDELPFTHEGQKLAEAYAFKIAKRTAPASFAEHQFKKKDTGMAAPEPAASASSPADTAVVEPKPSGTPLPELRAKSKKK